MVVNTTGWFTLRLWFVHEITAGLALVMVTVDEIVEGRRASVTCRFAESPVGVAIDLKPALSVEELRARLQRDFDNFGKRGFRNLLAGLLPNKMIDPFIEMTGIPADRPGHQITAAEREFIAGIYATRRKAILTSAKP